MLSLSSSILLPTISHGQPVEPIYDAISDTVSGLAVGASGYYLSYQSGHQTIAISLNELDGELIIEASLVHEPKTDDWAQVFSVGSDSTVISGNYTTNLVGNYVWMRARVERFADGTITEVRLTF